MISLIGEKDITLDLKDLSSNTYQVGISLLLCDNVTIKNVTLSNLSIECFLCTNIHFENIKITNIRCDNPILPLFAMLFYDSSNISLESICIENINVSASTLAGIALVNTNNSTFTKVTLKNFFNESGVCSGISHINSH